MSNLRKQCAFEVQGRRCPIQVMPPHPETIWCYCIQHQGQERYLAIPVETNPTEGISALTHAAYLRSRGYPAREWQNHAVIIGPTRAPTLYFYSDKRTMYETQKQEDAIIAMTVGEGWNISHIMGRKGSKL